MENVRFVRINGRVVPIRQKGLLSSEAVRGSEGERIVKAARARVPGDFSKARKLAFATGAAYGLGTLALGAAATRSVGKQTASSIKNIRRLGKFGIGSVVAAAGLLVGQSIYASRSGNFRIADEGLKGVGKNIGEGLLNLGLVGAGAASPFLATRAIMKLKDIKRGVRTAKKGVSVVNKYDILSKFKAYRAKNVTPPKKFGGLLGK